jgi:anti-sigma regulatory factor (Ser/Thr protein kinase)
LVPSLSLPGKLDSLKAIRDFVAQAAETAGLDKMASYRLNLAVDEIATNIITHGYEEANLEGNIIVHADIDERTLTIRLEDQAIAYDPSHKSNPVDIDKPLDQRQEGGLGVFLAVRSVDQFTYERIGERNLHTFVMERGD